MLKATFSPITKDDIIRVEEQLSVQLPTDYIDFLLVNNGCVSNNDNFSVDINMNGTVFPVNLDVMFGINTGNNNSDIEFWTEKFSDEMLESSVIIADTIQHGFIVLVCSGQYTGVYYWDDSYHFEFSCDDVNTYFISDTFNDFLDLIDNSDKPFE